MLYCARGGGREEEGTKGEGGGGREKEGGGGREGTKGEGKGEGGGTIGGRKDEVEGCIEQRVIMDAGANNTETCIAFPRSTK